MRLGGGPLRTFTAWSVLSGIGAATVVSQVPDTTRRQPALVTGQVVDSGGVGIADAEIMILAGDKSLVAPTASDSRGAFRFRGVPPGGPYTLLARKIATPSS